MNRLMIAAAALALTFGVCVDAEAQLFGRRTQSSRSATSRSGSNSSLPQSLQRVYNPNNLPLTRLQERWIERTAEKDQKEAAKKGISVQAVMDRRMKRLETFAAIARGLGAGLSGASASAAAWNHQAQMPAASSRTAGAAASRNQALWNQYNRNYGNESRYFFLDRMR